MPYEINRTELVWPGKYDETGKRQEADRVSLPFQVIERVNESPGHPGSGKAAVPHPLRLSGRATQR